MQAAQQQAAKALLACDALASDMDKQLLPISAAKALVQVQAHLLKAECGKDDVTTFQIKDDSGVLLPDKFFEFQACRFAALGSSGEERALSIKRAPLVAQ